MRKRQTRRLAADLRTLGIPSEITTEIFGAVTSGSNRHRPRVTAEVASRHTRHLLAGEIDVNAFYFRVWALHLEQYFEPLHKDERPDATSRRARQETTRFLAEGGPAAAPK